MKKDLVVYKPKTPAVYTGVGGKPKKSMMTAFGKKFGAAKKMGKSLVKKGIKFGVYTGIAVLGAQALKKAGEKITQNRPNQRSMTAKGRFKY